MGLFGGHTLVEQRLGTGEVAKDSPDSAIKHGFVEDETSDAATVDGVDLDRGENDGPDLQVITPETDEIDEDPRLSPNTESANDSSTSAAIDSTQRDLEKPTPAAEADAEVGIAEAPPAVEKTERPTFSLDDDSPLSTSPTMERMIKPIATAENSPELFSIKDLDKKVAEAIERIKDKAEAQKNEIDGKTKEQIKKIEDTADQIKRGVEEIEKLAA